MKASGRAERLRQLELLLLAHPEGLTASEVARRLGTHRSTAGRDIDLLSTSVPIYEHENGRKAIDRDSYLSDLRLTLHEIMALHLATRLLADHSDRHNRHAVSAVRKLARALRPVGARIADVIEANAEVMDKADVRRDLAHLKIVEELTRAWATGRTVAIKYHTASGEPRSYNMDVYLIRPYASGHTAHVIGRCHGDRGVRTLRIDRIERAMVTDEEYSIPSDLNLDELLRGAWGVWYGDEPSRIVLRFSPRAARRVRETMWHTNETLMELPDGRLEWRAEVSEAREVYPWIRGWGSAVEIVEPRWLREEFAGEVRQMAVMYGVGGRKG